MNERVKVWLRCKNKSCWVIKHRFKPCGACGYEEDKETEQEKVNDVN